jgi:hypothetical protein
MEILLELITAHIVRSMKEIQRQRKIQGKKLSKTQLSRSRKASELNLPYKF